MKPRGSAVRCSIAASQDRVLRLRWPVDVRMIHVKADLVR